MLAERSCAAAVVDVVDPVCGVLHTVPPMECILL